MAGAASSAMTTTNSMNARIRKEDNAMKGSRGIMKWLVFMALLAVIVGLAGCGSANKESAGTAGAGTTVAAATVGIDICAQCHAANIEAWMKSRHGNTDPLDGESSGSPNSIGSPSNFSATCSRCHDPLQDSANLTPGLTGNFPRMVIGCESCHGGGSLHYGMGPIGLASIESSTMGSAQFNTCTVCHMLLDSTGTTTHPSPQHSSDAEEVITDTHFDDPATATPEGYNVSRFSDTACTNCHDPHTAILEVNEQWIHSGHGNLAADPWSHYDWKAANRQSCQRCHTATGAANYLTSPATYNAANNVFSHLTGSQQEVLYCNGCHLNASGGIRNPGTITAPYSGASYTYPNAYKSNLCLACHTGRESGGSVLASTGTFTNLSFINSHYLTAGGTVYTVTGYETWYTMVTTTSVTTRTFTNPSTHHDDIGRTSGTPSYQDRLGPCVGCHMTAPEKHLFEAVSKPSGTIIAIETQVCDDCHNGVRDLNGSTSPAWTPATLEAKRPVLADALEALNVQLQQRSIHFYNAHPYFYTAPYNAGYTEVGLCTDNLPVKNWQTGGTSTFTWNATSKACVSSVNAPGTDNTGKNNMGAAFNYNLIEHDPGAFVHNRRYAARLIYDSIDWLDDNVMNSSVAATLAVAPHNGQPYQANAQALLNTRQ